VRKATNVEFVTNLMEYGQYGPLTQIFIIDAIQRHAEHFAKMDPVKLQEAWGENYIIDARGWIEVAKMVKEALERH